MNEVFKEEVEKGFIDLNKYFGYVNEGLNVENNEFNNIIKMKQI